MKIEATANNRNVLRMTRSEWVKIGKNAGWEVIPPEDSRDINVLISKARKAVRDLDYEEKTLGDLKDGKIVLFKPKVFGKRKRVLIVAGQHGEEIAGPWSLIKFLEKNKRLLKEVAVSFVPTANPHGFKTGERNGVGGSHINWFLTKDKKIRNLGEEAKVFYDHFDLLGKSARDGLLNLHEDETASGFYLYVLGDSKDKVVSDMLTVGKKHFDCKRDGHYEDNDGYDIVDGVVDNHKDLSFDEAMQREFDIPILVTIETPQREAKIDDRTEAAAEMAAAFVRGISK